MLISSPENYGLTREQTLALTVDGDPPDGFEAYWRAFGDEVELTSSRWHGTVDAGVGEVWIPSLRAVRVVGRLTMPDPGPCGLVIRLHDDDPPEGFEDDASAGFAARGLATLDIRVRGFPPSTIDVEDLRDGWIMHDIEDAESWVVRGAVGDVVQAFRCARRHFGDALPIAIEGAALGAGLAVIASAQLARRADATGAALVPSRLAIAHPDLGAWRWRSGRYCNGAGRRVNERLVALRDESPRLMRGLELFDAALHARAIATPTLCKLATRDDVVLAPSAAAVFNGLATQARWRFVTAFGHYDGGLVDARRHECFAQVIPRFLDPGEDPVAAAALLPG